MNNQVKVGVAALLFYEGRLLLFKRKIKEGSNHLDNREVYAAPGGKMVTGDLTIDLAIKREVREETNIYINLIGTFISHVINKQTDTAYITFVGVANITRDDLYNIKLNDEHLSFDWFDLDALPDDLYLPTKHAISIYRNANVKPAKIHGDITNSLII